MKKSEIEYFKTFQSMGESDEEVNNKVWIYTRVSTKGQTVNFSLDNQRKEIDSWVDKNGFVVSKSFVLLLK